MIYLATALYCEAKPWIEGYHLKKDTSSKGFQIFQNEEFVLILTKTGKVNGAIAVNELFHRYPPTQQDFLINFGIAAASDPAIPLGTGYLCHKITDADTFHTIYPDLLYQHPFQEAALTTVSRQVTSSSAIIASEAAITKEQSTHTLKSEISLYDMEATGIYTAALLQLQQHQLCFYKIVSDHGLMEQVTPEQISTLLMPHIELVKAYADNVIRILKKEAITSFTEEETSLMEALCQKLYLSVTMTYQFKQILYYSKLCGKPLASYLSSQLEQLEEQPCTSKKEGKIQLERIRTELL